MPSTILRTRAFPDAPGAAVHSLAIPLLPLLIFVIEKVVDAMLDSSTPYAALAAPTSKAKERPLTSWKVGNDAARTVMDEHRPLFEQVTD